MSGQRCEVDGFVSEYRYVEDDGAYDRIFYPVSGFFVMPKDSPYAMKLYDAIGRFLHPMNRVAIARTVANSLEGDVRFPRPFVMDYKDDAERNSGKFPSLIVSKGDFLKISYIGGNIFKPIVECAIENFAFQTQVPFLRTDPTDLERKAKRFENDDYVLEFQDDGKGALTLLVHSKTGEGSLSLNMVGKENGGKLNVTANGKLTINVQGKSGEDNVAVVCAGKASVQAEEVIINGGTKGAARLDDEVQVTAEIGQIAVDPGTHTNPAPITITGKITAASGTTKIGN